VSTVCFKPNGVLLTPDDQALFAADARGQRIFKYDVRGPGKLANETLWIDALVGNPDGLTLDEEGNLYVCLGRDGMKIYSREAQWLGVLDMLHASNCCFGGPDFATLYVTSVDKFLAINTKVVGIKPPCLRGAS
jgi:sugar lactone lactonase YvrE